MFWKARFWCASALVAISSNAALAGCEVDIADYVGWQIIYAGEVTGYIDEDGVEHDEFEGCEWGRVLIIDYTKAITCDEYEYDYAYHPDIVILSNGSSMEACIDDEIYDVRRN